MAAVSLFWDTNMAAVTSCENTLHYNFLVDTGECIKLPGTREIGSGDRPLLNFFIEFIRVKPSSEKRWRCFCAYSFHRNTNHRNAEGMLSVCPTYFCDATISPLSLRCFFDY